MNISEFAERIVFSNSLEEKLAAPGKLSFDRLSSSKLSHAKSLRMPGRPSHLKMQHEPGRNIQPPGDDQLEDEKARGQLLHFLANHELLATELMALVLLKFPNAPRSFRQGILVTLQEEQQHTRMYLQRMKECGVDFGTWPVSGQFWRVVEPMDSPMDFVSRLSLTFEQANLDYSLHFASVFRRIGDTQTAGLLQKIYEDEIGHVQHGLHWFRQWKDPEKSDFDAWHNTLDFPMSPARARGPRNAFNRDGRRKAGLSDDFIDAVEVFGQSKDRSAVVRWFDPRAEAELAGHKDPKLEQLGSELESLMVAMAKPDDVVMVRELPSTELRKHWVEVGIELPEFCLFDHQDELRNRKLNQIQPWAWTPKNERFISPIIDAVRHMPNPWNDSLLELYRKSWGSAALSRWTTDCELPSWMGGSECCGISVGKSSSLSNALMQIADRGFETAVFKPDLSSSGRGMHRIQTDSNQEKRFDCEAVAVVEPCFERVADLSFLWQLMHNDEAKFLGWTRPIVSKGGRYEGTLLGNPFFDCNAEVRQFLLAEKCQKLKATATWLEERLLPELRSRNFRGNFGVDAFVYRDRDSKLKIRPFVELNPRTTMGHVGLALEKRVVPGTSARLRILTQSQYRAQRNELESRSVKLTNRNRWSSGVVWFGERSNDAMLIPCVTIQARNARAQANE